MTFPASYGLGEWFWFGRYDCFASRLDGRRNDSRFAGHGKPPDERRSMRTLFYEAWVHPPCFLYFPHASFTRAADAGSPPWSGWISTIACLYAWVASA